jgi:hypothetical protein
LARLVLEIDVAHPPRHPDAVEEALLDALAAARNSPVVRIIKIIHGYGSSGRGGSTSETVRNWAFRMRRRILAVIPGEEFSRFDEATLRMRAETGPFADPDLDASNRGVTYLWVR